LKWAGTWSPRRPLAQAPRGRYGQAPSLEECQNYFVWGETTKKNQETLPRGTLCLGSLFIVTTQSRRPPNRAKVRTEICVPGSSQFLKPRFQVSVEVVCRQSLPGLVTEASRGFVGRSFLFALPNCTFHDWSGGSPPQSPPAVPLRGLRHGIHSELSLRLGCQRSWIEFNSAEVSEKGRELRQFHHSCRLETNTCYMHEDVIRLENV
jgi:hypothetical protein